MPKKPLDANKPRGAVTAYTLFIRTCREELRRKYPQLTVDYNVIVKKCSERWKNMNEGEKKRFNDAAEIQRKRAKEELANYEQEKIIKQQQQQQSATSSILLQTPATQYLVEPQSHTLIIPNQAQHTATTTIVSVPKKAPKKRKPKDPHAPKKPLSAYFLFCADERPKVHGSQTGMSVSDTARELGVRWKNAPPELKAKYEQAASEKKHMYQAEMAIYKHQTSNGSSPPETPQTPLTPHDYQPTYSQSLSLPPPPPLPQQQQQQQQQQHPQLQQILQQQSFSSYDNGDTAEPPTEFDMMVGDSSIDENDE